MEIKEINWTELSTRFLDYIKNKIEENIKKGIYDNELEGLIIDEKIKQFEVKIKECDDGIELVDDTDYLNLHLKSKLEQLCELNLNTEIVVSILFKPKFQIIIEFDDGDRYGNNLLNNYEIILRAEFIISNNEFHKLFL